MTEFLHEFLHVLTDPAHAAAEIVFTLLVEVLGLGVIWPFLKRRIRRDITAEHHVIDAEHGVTHGTPASAATIPAPVSALTADLPRGGRVYDHALDGL